MSERAFFLVLLVTCVVSIVYDIAQIIRCRREHREFMAAMRDRWREKRDRGHAK